MEYKISTTNDELLERRVRQKIDRKTKPVGSLGMLEEIALKIALIQKTETPKLCNPHLLVFAADHGIAREGVSAYPPEVTAQMVLNFVNGGAAINVFSRQHGIELKIIDAGVNYDFGETKGITNLKINNGTKNFLYESSMTEDELRECFRKGILIIDDLSLGATNVVGFGEMGIGNTSSASALMSLLLNLPIDECVGRGTGLTDTGYQHKISILKQAIENKKLSNPGPLEALQHVGGFEIAMMAAAMLRAAEKKIIVLIDGFITTTAFLCAYKINPQVLEYAFFCHLSQEKGHRLLLDQFNSAPLLRLNLRLGEGTGCAVAYPILESAVAFLTQMASFESAGVSDKEK